MLPATSALIDYIDANESALLVDLFTFALSGGGTLRFAGTQNGALTIPSANFPGSPLNYAATGNRTFAFGPRFGRTTIERKIGTDATELDITVQAGPDDIATAGLTWQQAAVAGVFDGAQIELDRLVVPAGTSGYANTSLGAVTWFFGVSTDIDVGRDRVTFKVKSPLALMANQQMPRRIFTSPCTHIFGDAMCAYDRTAGKNAAGSSTGIGAQAIAAGSGSSQNVITLASGTVSAANYTQGTCVGVTGANAGVQRTIISVGSTTAFGLARPFPFAVEVGDTFQLLPGCDHTLASCQNKFNNLARYGGFPYIPPPEDAF